jgi:hypothetical protein
VLKESQREMLLLTLVEKLRAAIPPQRSQLQTMQRQTFINNSEHLLT